MMLLPDDMTEQELQDTAEEVREMQWRERTGADRLIAAVHMASVHSLSERRIRLIGYQTWETRKR